MVLLRNTRTHSNLFVTRRNMPGDGWTGGRRHVLLSWQGTRILRSTVRHLFLQRGVSGNLLPRVLLNALRTGWLVLPQAGKVGACCACCLHASWRGHTHAVTINNSVHQLSSRSPIALEPKSSHVPKISSQACMGAVAGFLSTCPLADEIEHSSWPSR